MNELKWFYYNHALLPKTAPHEKVDETVIKQGKLWKYKWAGVPLLIRWTTDFDCPEKTEWWYCIKDTPFDINTLKSKRRYEINKGRKNFIVKEINPLEFKEEIYRVQVAAFESYPLKYRPKISREKLWKIIEEDWIKHKVYGAFYKDSSILSGILLITYREKCITLRELKVIPKYEKYGINAAIIACVLENMKNKIEENFYICDGERNISHETCFQEYLEKYFNFRKAYCKLNIQYRFWIRILINILYPFRKILNNLNKNILLHKINALLYMEQLKRKS